MSNRRLPPALQDRLGHEATAGLVELLSDARKEWTAEVIGIVGDRFERRLTEETSKLRIEMSALRSDLRQEMFEGFASLRQEMAETSASLRREMTEGSASLRREMTEGFSLLRQEMTALRSDLRQEMAAGSASLHQALADQRFEILKWVFLFWVGQFFAVASLAAVLVRFLRPAG